MRHVELVKIAMCPHPGTDGIAIDQTTVRLVAIESALCGGPHGETVKHCRHMRPWLAAARITLDIPIAARVAVPAPGSAIGHRHRHHPAACAKVPKGCDAGDLRNGDRERQAQRKAPQQEYIHRDELRHRRRRQAVRGRGRGRGRGRQHRPGACRHGAFVNARRSVDACRSASGIAAPFQAGRLGAQIILALRR